MCNLTSMQKWTCHAVQKVFNEKKKSNHSNPRTAQQTCPTFFPACLGFTLLCSLHPCGTVISTAGTCGPFLLKKDTRRQVRHCHKALGQTPSCSKSQDLIGPLISPFPFPFPLGEGLPLEPVADDDLCLASSSLSAAHLRFFAKRLSLLDCVLLGSP